MQQVIIFFKKYADKTFEYLLFSNVWKDFKVEHRNCCFCLLSAFRAYDAIDMLLQ